MTTGASDYNDDSFDDEDDIYNESVLNDIKNGVNHFPTKRVFHLSLNGHLDGHVFTPCVPTYLNKYDANDPYFEDDNTPRISFSPSIEGCLNAILGKIRRDNPDKYDKMYVYITEKPLNQYKHKTNNQLIKDKKVYDANVTKEIWIEEPVRLKLYGVIRIDQISKNKTKQTVPTLNDKRDNMRFYYYKWHWLVKPKIIDKLSYDYSPTAVCESLVWKLRGFKYGIPINGKIQNIPSSEYYDKHYRLLSPEDFEKFGGGVCWDYVEWSERYLRAYGYECKKYYIYMDTVNADTHTFITVDDGNGGLLYPESAFKTIEGLHKIKNVEEAIKMIASKMFDFNDNSKYSEIKYYVWEYTAHPPYGSNCVQCTKYFSKGEPFYEGIVKNPKPKTVQESKVEYTNEYVDANILDKISLRPATISDVDMMTDMEFDSVLDGYPKDLSDDELVNIKRSVKQDAKESVWKTRMIVFKNKTIGMLTAYELKGYWYIGELYILEEYRGNGIGTMILKNEINTHDRLSLNVYKRNTKAIALYKSLGFVVSIETETTLFMTLTKDKIK